ncbi:MULTISPECIES: nucleoside triphosphate pyrophosphohydrolase [Clostridium]|uniref:nucleoside triphosphate pyrophosphohydrolase n=1 Tax=Clostridium TaxID=1485 RepID=UPI00082584D3|nr:MULTISPECIES: nucleoside triphosphate pyrophosphohydrolase [Clostridium]PJI08787.1 nucleoside triphosphate pyrophosphohydrolase [Clostridium sp. CT7]
MISIVGLGPGSKKALTLGTVEKINAAHNVFFRTKKHPVVEYFDKLGIKYSTYDGEYDAGDNFEEVYSFIAHDLIDKVKELKDIVYAVPGHPLVAEKSVQMLIELCEKEDVEFEIVPAVSFVDALMESLKIDPIKGIKIVDAFDIKNQVLDKRIGLVVTQVYNNFIASDVKLALTEYYKDETEIYFVRAAGIEGQESIRKIPLYELDRQNDIDYLTSVYVPQDLNNNKDFYDLLNIMSILRGENGCPWDREQNHDTVKRSLIEESYEAVEAIDKKDDAAMVEELGDVLFQVIFHAQIGKEEGYFNINDIISGICNKMIERHPHVFNSEKLKNSTEVLKKWDEIKRKEQNLKSFTDEMKHIPKNFPALIRAEKVQKKASKVGFDFEDAKSALNKVFEEINEVKDVYKGIKRDRITEEVGDLIFSVVNVARLLDIDSEFALNYTIDKFIKRFSCIENGAKEKNIDLKNMSLEEMNALWNEAKSK